ncbi:hypothetical protein LXL04_033923 [Taraxacum kok-saghyz]
MSFVLFLCLQVDKDVIDENYHRSVQHGAAHPIHEIHGSSRCVGETERHHHKLIVSIACAKRRLLHVALSHPHLVVTGSQIDLREPSGSLKLIKQVVDPWKRITILYGEFVQLPIINAHPLGAILLFHEQDRGSPKRTTRSDELLFEEFLQLSI